MATHPPSFVEYTLRGDCDSVALPERRRTRRRYSRRAMKPIEQRATPGTAAPSPTLDQIFERLGVDGASDAVRRRTVAERAYTGRLPLAWLQVLRRAGFLPHDVDIDG